MEGSGTTTRKVNVELVNSLAKRAEHRLIARQLRRSPAVLDRARQQLADWRAACTDRPVPYFVPEWEHVLEEGDATAIARSLTARSAEMTDLRNSSPFPPPGLSEAEQRRLWQTSRKILESRIATSTT